MASGQPMVSSLFAQDSVNPLSFFLKKVLWRWASGVGGRRKMMLGAANHGPAHRRPGQDGRFPAHRGKGRVRQPPWRRSSHFPGTALLPPMGEGSRKGDLKKIFSPLSCQHTAADWTSTNAVKTNKKVKMI